MRDKMNRRLLALLDECGSKRRSSPAYDGFDGEAQLGLRNRTFFRWHGKRASSGCIRFASSNDHLV
jgi:hypothetical protein